MYRFSNTHISLADRSDIVDLRNLLNGAYRGELSKKGWTTEANIIAGDIRTDDQNILETMEMVDSIFFKYTNEKNELIGCVNLQAHGRKLYLGMFAVHPLLQGAGIGKHILQAADEYARNLNFTAIYMSVISVRTELINWYKRNGYEETGERKIFKEDGLSGIHLQPLEFMILEKQVKAGT